MLALRVANVDHCAMGCNVAGYVRYNLDIISTRHCACCADPCFLLFNVMCTQNNMTTSVSKTHTVLRHVFGCREIIVPSESECNGSPSHS